jgi:hypothetical protein
VKSVTTRAARGFAGVLHCSKPLELSSGFFVFFI